MWVAKNCRVISHDLIAGAADRTGVPFKLHSHPQMRLHLALDLCDMEELVEESLVDG